MVAGYGRQTSSGHKTLSRKNPSCNVHLIVTCTRRKTVAAGDTIFPDERDAEIAYGAWQERVAKAKSDGPSMTAGELYTGQHWNVAPLQGERHGSAVPMVFMP